MNAVQLALSDASLRLGFPVAVTARSGTPGTADFYYGLCTFPN